MTDYWIHHFAEYIKHSYEWQSCQDIWEILKNTRIDVPTAVLCIECPLQGKCNTFPIYRHDDKIEKMRELLSEEDPGKVVEYLL